MRSNLSIGWRNTREILTLRFRHFLQTRLLRKCVLNSRTRSRVCARKSVCKFTHYVGKHLCFGSDDCFESERRRRDEKRKRSTPESRWECACSALSFLDSAYLKLLLTNTGDKNAFLTEASSRVEDYSVFGRSLRTRKFFYLT